MEVLPLCYAVAPTENYDNWKWFLDCMDGCVSNVAAIVVPFMSNRCKGLIAVVKDTFPGKIHGMCAHHLRANVKTQFGKAAEGFFNATVSNIELLDCQRFNEILVHLEKSTAKGVVAAAYIRKLDPKLYARYAFPLPRFGHVTSNPCEATNSGLLNIREFAPFKLLVEMWFYIQNHFNSSRKKAVDCQDTLTPPALFRHNENLATYCQFQVFDDQGGTARVCTTTGSEEYLVTKGERNTCTCFELQEMLWPCEHMMAWEDIGGKGFSKHFAKCWRVKSWRKLYSGVVPSFLCNDIKTSNKCSPPEVAVKRGRHRVVRITSGTRVTRAQRTGEDVLTDPLGNLYMQYPIDDDQNLVDAMPTPATTAAQQKTANENRSKSKPGPNSGKIKCGLCGQVGHNRRTCKSTAAGAGGGETGNEVPNRERATKSREEVLELYPVDGFNAGEVGDKGHGAAESGQGREDVDMDTLIGLYRSVPGYPLSDVEEEEASEEEERHKEPSGNCYVRFGTMQESQHPDFAPYGYDGPMDRIYEIAENMERYMDHPYQL
ncbi:unnamed protein product [Calypogeia fissa]